MRTPETLPPADALPPDWGRDRELLRQALSEGGAALPAVSSDLLADQLAHHARLEALLVEAGTDAEREAAVLEPQAGDRELPADLLLLTDLIVAQAQVAAGSARAPSPAVLEAACAAFEADLSARAASSVAPAVPAREAQALVLGSGLRVLGLRGGTRGPARATRAVRPGRRIAAAAAVLVACVGTWLLARSDGSSSDPGRAHEPSALGSSGDPSATELASLSRTLSGAADESTAVSPGSRAQVAPFVEARLWRRVAGRALRGGESLGLAQGLHDQGVLPADVVPADVVLSWLPDAASGRAARLRVHVSGPEGLVVLLPDLGVEAVLAHPASAEPADGAAVAGTGVPPATYVDLELPGGWSDQLAERELRLAFRWPAPAASATAARPPAPTSLASAQAHFVGVSLGSVSLGSVSQGSVSPIRGQAVKGS